MTRWVERDETGGITGHYANWQEGFAEEEMADDDPELLMFDNPPGAPAPTVWRVTKYTIQKRLKELGLLIPALMWLESWATLPTAPERAARLEMKAGWDGLQSFLNTDVPLRAMLQGVLGLNPDVILAPDDETF